jgi:hypothetical protein
MAGSAATRTDRARAVAGTPLLPGRLLSWLTR